MSSDSDDDEDAGGVYVSFLLMIGWFLVGCRCNDGQKRLFGSSTRQSLTIYVA
jgi:hypothetical protein